MDGSAASASRSILLTAFPSASTSLAALVISSGVADGLLRSLSRLSSAAFFLATAAMYAGLDCSASMIGLVRDSYFVCASLIAVAASVHSDVPSKAALTLFFASVSAFWSLVTLAC